MSDPFRVLVIGARGTVGRLVVRRLLLVGGLTVRALSRSAETAAFPKNVEVVSGDLTDLNSLRPALEGVAAVFLVWPFATHDGADKLLDVIAEGAGRIVYLSSQGVRPHEREIEQLIERSGLAWTVLRPHAFAANTLRWAEQIRAEAVVRAPYGDAAMAPVDERDIAEVAVCALVSEGHSGATYELTGPRVLMQSEQARSIGEAIGRPVHWQEVPPVEAKREMLGWGWPSDAVDAVMRAQAKLAAHPGPVTSTVQDVTGRPARMFGEWVADHALAFRTTMRAARMREYGDASIIRDEEIAIPGPGPGEVLIRVAATSFNPSEMTLRSGLLQDVLPLTLPYTFGWDVSGTVVQLGPGASGYSVGDRVIGRLDEGGAAAEYATARADVLVTAPATVPLTDAAAIPIAALTAWQALFEHARIAEGQRVLINGAGGGVGMFAVQLAKHGGTTVIATAGRRSEAAVRRYGADQIIDYTRTSLAQALDGPVDVVINLAAITPQAAAELVPLVRPGGVIVSITVPVDGTAADVTTRHLVARNNNGQLAEIVDLIDAGLLVVEVTETHPIADLALVHRKSETGRIHGKVTLTPWMPPRSPTIATTQRSRS